jgi:predicted nucleotidyltransferase
MSRFLAAALQAIGRPCSWLAVGRLGGATGKWPRPRGNSPHRGVNATPTTVVADAAWLDELRQKTGNAWPHIARAKAQANEARQKVKTILSAKRLPSAGDGGDASVVVFGSLAREEFLEGSDLDWTLLIDGRTMPEQLRMTSELARDFHIAGFGKPGRTGIFGHMASSHDLAHHIGGDADTNQNTTRRVLLLLESKPIGDMEAHDRTVRAILTRYLEDDASFVSEEPVDYKIPRFLLNDIVRFWRTMAVDYAAKRAERDDEEWALRNAKLRMSRKLLFAAGLLLCFSVNLHPSEDLKVKATSSDDYTRTLVSHLLRSIGITPLELVARSLATQYDPATTSLIFDTYDEFLSILENERGHLKKLTARDSRQDSVFNRIRDISHDFQKGLSKLFFERPDLQGLVHKYGVF